MPDNRLTLTIEAQNLAQAAFKQFQTDVRQSNEALQKTGQAGRQSSTGIKVVRDELGRFHNVATGRFVSAARLLKEGFTEVERGAEGSTEAIKRANPVITRMRREFNLLRTDIHNTAAVSRQFSTAIQSQIRVQIDAAANLERLRVGLVSTTGSITAATAQYQRLVEVSRLPGINIENSLRATIQLQSLRKSGEEATEVIREFGNALALSGTAPRELNQVINAIRQMSGEGKILQEDIAIITTRVARLVPILQDAFGGPRAKDVREFFDALGVDESEQADRFLRIVLDRLAELPRAGETAANAIENLGDTTQRVQAAIGANFLPLVREATGALEGLLKEIERDPQVARNIAILEALGGTFLAVTAAAAGFAAALPAVAAGLTFLATNPIGLTIVAVAALTAGLVALKVASQDIETQVKQLATTFDELDKVLRANHEAIQSNQQAAVESARGSLTIQRDAIRQHITLLEEERASIERSIEANRKRAERGLLPIASTGESFGTQLDNANARLEVTRHRLQEVNDALRANEEAAVPIQKATVNIDTLTKAVTRLKEELEEETTFEGISQSVTGDPAGFRQSAQALADIEVLARVNTDRFKELREAAASGNQEAATALSKLNQQFHDLRDTQADRHIDNLSAAFDELSQSTNVTSSQLADVLRATQAFFNAFQGTGGLIQDDVARAAELIDDIQARLNSVRREEQLPEPERQRRSSQADEAPESQIEQIREQRQKELQAQVDVARQLFQIRKDIREAENQAEIDAAEEQATALLRVNGRFVSQFIELRGLIADEAIAQAERLTDQSLARLSNEVEERQALYEDDLKSQRQVEQAKRQENEKTYDFDALLTALRTKNRQAAAQDLIRLEERALDISSKKQIEGLIRETAQFIDAYAERGEVFRDLVQDAQDLGTELQDAFDLTEQQKRLEDFQDTVQDVLSDLIGLSLDKFSLTDTIADALRNDVPTVRFDAELNEFIFDENVFRDVSDALTGVTLNAENLSDAVQSVESSLRLVRFDEDVETRRERLGEDSAERIRRLEAQRRRLLASRPTGDQRGVERVNQRIQDVTARIAEARRDARTRGERFEEDTETRRTRLIEDALNRQAQATSEQTSVFEDIGQTLETAMKNALADQLAGYLTKAAFDAGIGTLSSALGGILSGLGGAIGGALGGLFGGGGQDTGQPAAQQQPGTPQVEAETPDLTGKINIPAENITVPTEALALKGAVTLAATDITAPTEAVAIKAAVMLALTDITAPTEPIGLTGDINQLTVSAVPPVIYLKGIINDIMVDSAAAIPTINPAAVIQAISTDPSAAIPQVSPVAVIRSIIRDASAEVPQVNPAAVVKSISVDPSTEVPNVSPAGVVNQITIAPNTRIPNVNPRGEINDLLLSPTAVPPNVSLTGDITQLNKNFTEPIPLQGRIDAELNLPDASTLPPIDLSGIGVNLPSIPPINVPVIFTPDTTAVENALTPRRDDTIEERAGEENGDGSDAVLTAGQSSQAAVVANEGRRDKVLGTGNPTVQTNITSEELTKAIVEGNRQSNESGYFNPLLTAAEGIQSLASAILSSGVAVGGDGVSLGADSGGLTDAQVEALAASLGEDLDSSFRSDFIPTLLGNQPGTVQPGDADPDEDTAQAPAAARFDEAAASISAVADVLSLEALANVAQDATLISLGDKLDSIRSATERIADQPLVDQLIEAGVAFPQTLDDRTNSFLPDVLSQGGLNQFTTFGNLERRIGEMGELTPDLAQLGSADNPGFFNLANLSEIAELLAPTPDLMQIGSAENPGFFNILNLPEIQKVEVTNPQEKVEVTNEILNVQGNVKAEVQNTVGVRQVGTFAVTQAGQFVVQLASGDVIPVEIVGGLEGLAVDLADSEVSLRAVGAI